MKSSEVEVYLKGRLPASSRPGPKGGVAVSAGCEVVEGPSASPCRVWRTWCPPGMLDPHLGVSQPPAGVSGGQ